MNSASSPSAVLPLARVTALYDYPVKGCRGCAVDHVVIKPDGPRDDRRFMVVGEADGRFLSQRSHPIMSQIGTELTATDLTLTHSGFASITVPRAESAPTLRAVSVWSSHDLQAEDAGDDVAAWLSELLDTAVRLVRTGPAFDRRRADTGDHVGFADGFPLLVASEASLADLNDRLLARGADAVPMDRFRPNIVVSECTAFAEDTWTNFTIGDAAFRAGGPCARCSVTTVDQATAERGPEPLRTLATFRRDAQKSSNVNFGQNLLIAAPGTIRVGDEVFAS